MKLNELKNLIKQVIKEEAENDNIFTTIKINGKQYNVLFDSKDQFKPFIYIESLDGEPYIDINTILADNLLLGAVWVKQGGKEEKLADTLTKLLKKSNRSTKNGFNTYILYDIIG